MAIFKDSKTIIECEKIKPELRGKTVSVRDAVSPKYFRTIIGDSTMHDGNFAFLTSALAKLNPNILEPKHNVNYTKDIPIEVSNTGFVDYITTYTVNWSGIANQIRNSMSNNTNVIPRVNAGMSQINYIVYTFELGYDIQFIELEKMKKLEIGKSLESIFKGPVMTGFDFFAENVGYFGDGAGHKGLFNHDDIVPVSTLDVSKATIGTATDAELVGIFNGILEQVYMNSNMNGAVVPDTFLIPSWFALELQKRMSNLYNANLFTYLKDNNYITLMTNGEVKITITSRPGLETLGAAGVGRIVAYKKDKEFVKMDIPYPMQHFITLPNIEKMAYTTAFVGQISEIQMPYNTSKTDLAAPVQYFDFTA